MNNLSDRWTPRARKALELSLREALSLGHNYIGTEHILLGLLREGGGLAVEVLSNLGVSTKDVQDEIIRNLRAPSQRKKQPPEPSLPELLRKAADALEAGT